MLNCTGKYVSVFQPHIKTNVSDKILFANLSSSKKNLSPEGEVTYENMSWNARFVGDAFEKAKTLKEKDKIDITKGAITNKYDKENQKLYVDVVVFDYEMSDLSRGDENAE